MPLRGSMSDLTIKQEKFAQKVVETGNASEAYRQSYDAANMSDKTIHEAASRLVNDSKVSARIAVLRQEAAARHAVTIDTITQELEEARSLAMQEKQTSSAVSASMGKAKLHGLVVEKKDIKVSPLEAILDEIDGSSADLPDKG